METLLEQQELLLSDGITKATIYPVWDGSILPLELIASLCNEYNNEIDKGQTYPETQKLTLDTFEKYWFKGVSGVIVEGEITNLEDFDMLEGNECLGSVCIQPCYPGRSSHICTANILVKARHRKKGIGKILCNLFLDWSLKLGYDYAIFPLVYSSNLAACKMLTDLGFEMLCSIPGAGILNDMDYPVDSHTYGKNIAPRVQKTVPRASANVNSISSNTTTSSGFQTNSSDPINAQISSLQIQRAQLQHSKDFKDIEHYLKLGKYPDDITSRVERTRIRSRARSYYIDDGLLKHKRTNAVVISDVADQFQLTNELHRQNHNGINKMQQRVGELYYWTGIKDTIALVIQNCPECRAGTTRPNQTVASLSTHEATPAASERELYSDDADNFEHDDLHTDPNLLTSDGVQPYSTPINEEFTMNNIVYLDPENEDYEYVPEDDDGEMDTIV